MTYKIPEGENTFSEKLFADGATGLIIGSPHPEDILRRCFLDRVYQGHGASYFGSYEEVLPFIPQHRVKDTILFTPDFDYPPSFNVLEYVQESERSAIAAKVVDAVAAAYPSNIPTPLLDNHLRAACLAMLSIPGGSLYELQYLFTSESYRAQIISRLKDPTLKNRWQRFHDLEPREQLSRTESVLNRLDPLLTDPLYRNIFAQHRSFTITEKTVLVASFPKTRDGDLAAALLMARLTGNVYIEAPHLFVGAGVPIIACRYLDQLPEKLRDKFIATATIVATRLGIKDAKLLADAFDVPDQDIQLDELRPGKAYVKNGTTRPITIPESDYSESQEIATKIIRNSRANYSVKRNVVERKIADFLDNIAGEA